MEGDIIKTKILLTLAIVCFVGQAAALEAQRFETYQNGSQKQIFSADEKIVFELNASDNQDYNITIEDSTGSKVVNDQPMTLISNDYYWFYQYNYTLGSNADAGNYDSFVNMTINKEATLADKEFHVANDTPDFFPVEYENRVAVGENTTVTAMVTDSEENVDQVEIETEDSRVFQMSQIESGDNYQMYEADFNVTATGTRNFDITAGDSNGNTGTYSASYVAERNDNSATAISIGVRHSCMVSLENFWVPGNGTLFPGELGYFTEQYSNEGSLKANLTVEYLNVTYENETAWQPGQEIGDSVRLFSSENYTINSTSSAYYQKTFENTTTPGWYTGRTEYNYSCSFPDGEVETFSNDAYETFEIVNASGGVSNQGNQSTNSTIPSNVTDFPGEDTNETVNQDSNITGQEGSPVEGDNSQAGQTPEPEPEPEPEPILSLDIEPQRQEYVAQRGQFTPVNLTLTNKGNVALSQLTIAPQISQIREGWEANNAQVANLGVNESVTREVLLRPPNDEQAGTYVVPVIGSNEEQDLDVDYFQVTVEDSPTFSSQMSIVESPRSVTLIQNTTQNLPVLIENTGQTNLTNISARLQNSQDCGQASLSGVDRIGVNESGSLNIEFESVSESQSCNTTLIISSSEGAYSFSNIDMTVTPEEGLIPEEYRVPFIAVAWTALLTAFAILKRRYELNSILVKAPFVLLVVGETVIFIYLAVDYYGLMAVSFLPF